MSNVDQQLQAIINNCYANHPKGVNRKIAYPDLKTPFKRALRIIDEQDAIQRYSWQNLPCNISSADLERLLYYKGQLCFFYDSDLEQFYFMPYALDGTIDFYGRFNRVHPVPMTSGTDDKYNKSQAELLANKKLYCVYDVLDIEKQDNKGRGPEECCVLLYDYTRQLSETIIPRQQLNDGIIDVMSDLMPFMRTSLLNATGVKGMRVNNADEASSVMLANESMNECALTGQVNMPIIGAIDFQELTSRSAGQAQEFLIAMQGLDNLRLSLYGIDNGGLFDKKSYVNEAQSALNGGPVGLVLKDGLAIRQQFCVICNELFGTNMWCDTTDELLVPELMDYNNNSDQDLNEGGGDVNGNGDDSDVRDSEI